MQPILLLRCAEGWAFNEIAKRMHLSPRTIGFLVAEIKCKAEKMGGSLEGLIEKYDLFLKNP